jgi:hypothetical protein
VDERLQIVESVRELAAFLRAHGEQPRADALDHDADLIAAGADTGVARILKRFGGAGTLSDLVFEPEDAGEQYAALRDRVWREAAHAHRTDAS